MQTIIHKGQLYIDHVYTLCFGQLVQNQNTIDRIPGSFKIRILVLSFRVPHTVFFTKFCHVRHDKRPQNISVASQLLLVGIINKPLTLEPL